MNWLKDLMKKFKPGATDQDVNDAKACGEDPLDENAVKDSDRINDKDSPKERKNKMAKIIVSCGKGMQAEKDDDGNLSVPFDQDPCATDAIKLDLEEIAESMGTGIDESIPAQEGFIPPPCYDYAKTIINAVRNDALFGNTNNTYNSSVIMLENVVDSMKNSQEISKFLVTSKDDSLGSRALRENTSKNSKYAHIFNNKDVKDFQTKIFGWEI